MELLTLADVLQDVGRFIENGAGACRPDLVAARVTEACERLIVKADLPYTTWKCRIRCDRGYFPLPREMESIIVCNIDNRASPVHTQAFEFMEAGPGESGTWEGTGDKSLEDMGLFCAMYDMPGDRPLHILALANSQQDAGKTVSVAGLDELSTPVSSAEGSFAAMAPVPVVRWADGIEGQLHDEVKNLAKSAKTFYSLTGFAKPKTAGHISLYAADAETGQLWFLAKAHPDAERPAWRRYKIRGNDGDNNVLVYGKAAALRLTRPTDVLPVQNRAAVKLMVQALEYEAKGQLKSAVEFEAQAMRILMEQKANHDNRGPVANVIDMNLYCSNAATNRLYSR